MSLRVLMLTAPVLLGAATASMATTQVTVSSYSMPNGNTGSYTYWDESYNGSGNSSVDGAFLSGGTGDLTDGYVETSTWGPVEAAPGPGPYVGWFYFVTPNPTITFNFAGSPTINSIAIQIDNSGGGGVLAPDAIWIDGLLADFTMPAYGQAGWAVASGLNLTGSSHTVQLFQQYGSWVFSSEMQFFSDDSAVPEPASWAMMIGGLGLVGAAMRRRARSSVRYV